MVLFCGALSRDSVPLLRFSIISYVHVFLCSISLVNHLKYLYSCFSFYFYFLIFVVFLFEFILLIFAAVINLTLLFFTYSLSSCVDASAQSAMLVSPPSSSFLDTYCQCHLLDVRASCIMIIFLVLWSISWSSSLAYFRNVPEYLTRETEQIIPWMRFLLQSFFLRSFIVLLGVLRVFHTSISWWSFTGVWVTVSLL